MTIDCSETFGANKISKEDLYILHEFKTLETFAELKLQVALAERNNAKLQSQNAILKIYLKYKLTNNQDIDDNTGEILDIPHEEEKTATTDGDTK